MSTLPPELRGWCVRHCSYRPIINVPHDIKQQVYPTDHRICKEIKIRLEVHAVGRRSTIRGTRTASDKRQLPLGHINTRCTVSQDVESRLTGCYCCVEEHGQEHLMKPLVQAVYIQARRQSEENDYNWGGQERSHKDICICCAQYMGSTIDQPIIQTWDHSLPYMHRHN